jgi:tetratricopeptide (TPR) repeat protein
LRILYSTKSGRVSYERDELKHGLFTAFLLRGIRGEAAGNDGVVTFRDLTDYVTNQVSAWGFRNGVRQVPYEAGEATGDFLVGLKNGPAPSAPATTAPVTTASVNPAPRTTTPPRETPPRSTPPPVTPPTTEPRWKDQAEYDMYAAVVKEPDPRRKITLIDNWKARYPNTELARARLQLYLGAYQPINDIPHLVSTLNELLALDPRDVVVMSPLMYYLIAGNNTSPAALDNAANTASSALANLDRKPATIDDGKWPETQKQIEALAHKTLGWVAMQRKDGTNARQEFVKSLAIDPNQGEVDYWLGNTLRAEKTPETVSQALFYYARAATYDGPGSLTPQGRQQLEDYLRKAYNSYHGQDDAGLSALKMLAKSQPAPPSDFKISTATEIATQKAEEFKRSNPQLALWMDVKKMLTAAGGVQYFEASMKSAAMPPLSGTVISLKPAVRPKEIVIGIADPNIPEATLKLDVPLRGQISVGQQIEFESVATAFQPDPFMITFDVEVAKIRPRP